MANIGKLDKKSTITEIIVTSDEHSDGNHGLTWAKNRLGGTWVLCSTGDNQPAKNIVPAVGYKYDKVKDAFIPPQPFESWSLNEETWTWEPPVPLPVATKEDEKLFFIWNEETGQWEVKSDNLAE